MTEQNLNGRQLGAVVEQLRGEAVAQGVRVDGLGDAGAARGLAAGAADDLISDRIARAADCRLGNIRRSLV